jgi:hypothetical protein
VAQASGLIGVAVADNGSFDSAFALTGNSGNLDFAGDFGSLSEATAGSSDIASGSYDIAAILAGGTGDATATGGNFRVDILPSLF